MTVITISIVLLETIYGCYIFAQCDSEQSLLTQCAIKCDLLKIAISQEPEVSLFVVLMGTTNCEKDSLLRPSVHGK